MAPIEFRAPWSKKLRLATAVSLLILLLALLAGSFAQTSLPFGARVLLVAAPLLITVAALVFAVRGYVLTEDAILVRRLGWVTRLPLAELRSVAGDAQAMQSSLRLFGNGGLFSFSGEFWNRRLGRYRALATDPSRAVILRYPQRTVVITPHDPQHFIVRTRTLLAVNKEW